MLTGVPLLVWVAAGLGCLLGSFHVLQQTRVAYGVCVSGQLVGILKASGLYYYDRIESVVIGPFGTTSTGYDQGSLGGVQYATQNSWTNHVTLIKTYDGAALYINFMPSVAEDREDRSANGTPTSRAHPDSEFQNLPGKPDMAQGWVRDWSWRRWDQISLTRLQGNSSLAAAAYALLFDVATLDSGRWGAGLPERYAQVSSFEAVHGYCVGAMLQLSPRVNRGHSRTYYGERAKFDMVLDAPTSAGSFLADEILTSINGWRKVEDGKLVVGIERRGHLPVWHFTDEQTNDGQAALAFLGRADGVNQVKVQFTNIRDEYRKDFGEANDEYHPDVTGRTNSKTITVNGISRQAHATWLATETLDKLAAQRRQLDFETHFLGYVLSPGDPIEVSHKALGVSKMPAIVQRLAESGERRLKVTAVEHAIILESIKHGRRNSTTPELPLIRAKTVEIPDGLTSGGLRQKPAIEIEGWWHSDGRNVKL